MYVTWFDVVSHGRFPLDMLRYDACHPASTDDAARIGDSLELPTVSIRDREPYRVRVVHYHPRIFWQPTEARWSSFGWSVDPRSINTRKVDA